MRMGLSRQLSLLSTFLACTALLVAASAQDPPKELISDGQPLHDNALLYPQYGQLAGNQIDGLLVSLKFWSRQQQVTCATNYTECQGTQFCCPNGNACCSGGTCCGAGTYCTTVGGVQGCCKLGHICSQVTNACTVADQQRCSNDNFCCPAGDTCYRDANNNPRCSSGTPPASSTLGSGPSSIVSYANPSHSGSTPTPTSHSSSLQTQCQLRPPTGGSLTRRKRTLGYSGPKRRGWFY